MAMKDWEKTFDKGGHITYLKKFKSKNDRFRPYGQINITKTTNNYEIEVDTKNVEDIQHRKSKNEAVKLAKNYMRSH